MGPFEAETVAMVMADWLDVAPTSTWIFASESGAQIDFGTRQRMTVAFP
jgi:hypothetical protein